jgi:hypothetical protein
MSRSSQVYIAHFQVSNEIDLRRFLVFKRVTSARTNRVKGYGHVPHWYETDRTAAKVNQKCVLHFASFCCSTTQAMVYVTLLSFSSASDFIPV